MTGKVLSAALVLAALLVGGCNSVLEFEPRHVDGVSDVPSEAEAGEEGAPSDCGNGMREGDEECDDGNETDGDGCDTDCTFSCHGDDDCPAGLPCASGRCDTLETHACVLDLLSDGTPCREKAGPCDLAERCTGTSEECPADELVAAGTVCNGGAGLCTHDGSCVVPLLALGSRHSCAIVPAGGVKCWGRNDNGELGNGTLSPSLSPVAVEGLPDAAALSLGVGFSCAVESPETVKCWGLNDRGQLGSGDTMNSPTPVTVEGLPAATVMALAVGGSHSCAALDNGEAWCWGANDHGQLGVADPDFSPLPVKAGPLVGSVRSLTAGENHTCGVLDGGIVLCWGCNDFGQLGNGTLEGGAGPVEVKGLKAPALLVAAGRSHSCALLEDGGIMCWGRNVEGQLGNGETEDAPSAVSVAGLAGAAIDLEAGGHTCAVLSSGIVDCWGNNAQGQLGDGSTTSKPAPVAVSGLAGGVAVSAGEAHSCAFVAGGGLFCWGSNDSGQLGTGTSAGSVLPASVTLQ
jgi:cysteine-rich repeat protein